MAGAQQTIYETAEGGVYFRISDPVTRIQGAVAVRRCMSGQFAVAIGELGLGYPVETARFPAIISMHDSLGAANDAARALGAGFGSLSGRRPGFASSAMLTPLGPADIEQEIEDGVTYFQTARGGCFRIAPKRLAELPVHLRRKGGWYRDDSGLGMLVIACPRSFLASDYLMAMRDLKARHPEAYRAHFIDIAGEDQLVSDNSFLPAQADDNEPAFAP